MSVDEKVFCAALSGIATGCLIAGMIVALYWIWVGFEMRAI